MLNNKMYSSFVKDRSVWNIWNVKRYSYDFYWKLNHSNNSTFTSSLKFIFNDEQNSGESYIGFNP